MYRVLQEGTGAREEGRGAGLPGEHRGEAATKRCNLRRAKYRSFKCSTLPRRCSSFTTMIATL